MNFLKEIGFSDEDIQSINDMNYAYIQDGLIANSENVLDIANYLIGLGVELSSIKEIFMYQVGLFFKTKNEIKTSFDEYETDSIIKSLNYDVNNIELIDFI